jgi:hemerythrin-like domain-containing protein
MSLAMDDLRHEHDALQPALELLDALSERLRHPERGQTVDPEDMRQLVGFFQEFADLCHHGKEEDLLYPALDQAGLALPDPLQQTLLAEHAQGLQALGQMQAQAGQPGAPLADAMQRYAALMRAHIETENQQVLPWADQRLDPEALARLWLGFQAHEDRVMGAGRHEKLHALLGSLRGRYLAERA